MKLPFILYLVFLCSFLSFRDKNIADKKTIILIRHAKSAHDNTTIPDFDRPLEAQGSTDAEKMGKFLGEKKLEIDRIVCSPSVRTKQTLAHLLEGGLFFNYSKINYDSTIYRCAPQSILDVIHSTLEGHKTIVIIAHNPAITDIANLLQNDKKWKELPTCGVVAINFADVKWSEIGEKHKGKLLFFQDPDKL
jgi:phosphohistidine phosphatase